MTTPMTTPMRDIKALHQKLCPAKFLGNYWKSVDYLAADETLKSMDVPEPKRRSVSKASKGNPSQTLVHPLIALAFIRWSNPVLFYARLQRIVEG